MATMTRRSALISLGAIGTLLVSGGAATALQAKEFMRPPGTQDENDFLSKCIRCQKCTQVCHAQIIQPISIIDSFEAMSTPTVVFTRDYCDFCKDVNNEVPRCAQVCPTGALKLTEEKAKVAGLPKIVKENCIAWDLSGCEVCVEKCPRDAIYQDELRRPVIEIDKCDGCGLCELACPSVSIRSASILVGNGKGVIMLPKGEVQA